MRKLFLVIFVLCFAAALPAQSPAERPNLIVIIADDMAASDSGAYGNKNIRTPNIDRLAAEGMRFDRAFLTCSSCSPSRASINTGRYPHNTGAPELHLPLPADQVLFSSVLRSAGYYTAAVGKWHLGGAVKNQYDDVVEGGGPSGCEQWVPMLRKRPKDKPFFFWLAAFDPHRAYQPGAIPNPHDPASVIVPPYLADTPEIRADLALYYDEIARLDSYVGLVLDELHAQNVADNTLILFISDNGMPFPRAKTTVYDSGIQTPFIVRWPRGVKPGQVNTQLVSSLDIAPTFIQLANAPAQPTFQGVSFLATLRDPSVAVRSEIFAEHNWHDYTARERAIRTERYLYIRNDYPDLTGSPPADAVKSVSGQEMWRLHEAGALNAHQSAIFRAPRAPEELYDVIADPHQLRNVISDPAHAEALARLRNRLTQWQQETDDQPAAARRPDEFDRRTGNPIAGSKKNRKKN